ncbi:hypothetical protein [Ferrimonas sp.]|uniref:hypothetical protein n=1 Tax=Ferrimonas sp. TaxID=2080861 RepID=UPI003A8FE8D1
MSKVMCRDRAEHYVWGDDCQGWHLVRSDQLSVIEKEVPPGVHHRFENRSCEPVRFLVISSPPVQGDRVEESHD